MEEELYERQEVPMKDITRAFIEVLMEEVFEEKSEAEAVQDLLDFLLEIKPLIDREQMPKAA
jgi:hypothetical protein